MEEQGEVTRGGEALTKGAWAEIRARIERMPEAAAAVVPKPQCAVCEDLGTVIREVEGNRFASPCSCRRERQRQQRLTRTGIPRKFLNARLGTFNAAGLDPSVNWALMLARGIVKTYPFPDSDRGLLLAGTCGVGKTHLAAALLAELVLDHGASGRFWDVGELLVQLKRGFSRVPAEAGDTPVRTEGDLFEELRRVEVLVLDDLGAARVTDWSFDEIWLMIGARYNANLLTVFTSNYPNLGVGEGKLVGGVRQETLGDRVGARTFSRLQEMCRPIEMIGADYRRRKTA